jgi:hypothetical protein
MCSVRMPGLSAGARTREEKHVLPQPVYGLRRQTVICYNFLTEYIVSMHLVRVIKIKL